MGEARRTLDRRRGGRKEVCCVSSVRLVGASGTARLRCARSRARSPSGGVEEWAKGSARVRRGRVDFEAKTDFSGLCLDALAMVVVEREYARDEVLIQELAARV